MKSIFQAAVFACLTAVAAAGGKPMDLVYSTVPAENGGKVQKLNLTLTCPDSTNPVPCFVYIHGGSWCQGSRWQCPFRTEMNKSGWAYASIDYRLNTKGAFPLPMQLEDCRAAIRFLRQNAATYGIDPARICIGGGSAGGHLAALLAVADGVDGGIVAAVDMFGPTEFRSMGAAMIEAERRNPGKNPRTQAIYKTFGTTDLDELLTRFDELSPVARLAKLPAGTKLPRFLIIHSKGDPVVPVTQSEMFYRALKKSGADAELKIYDGGGHSVPPMAANDIIDFLLRVHLP